MRINYSRQTGDSAVFLEGQEPETLESSPLVGELEEYGQSLGKRFVLKHEPSLRMESVLNRMGRDPKIGWDSIKEFELLVSTDVYSRLRRNKKVFLRDGANQVEIYGPVTIRDGNVILDGKAVYRLG
jgi:hypothetical protein